MTAEWMQGLLATLNPNHEPGRITLICRFGAREIERCLPPLIEAVRATGSPVLWMCDPMHGNTETAGSGYKTRRFDNIAAELSHAFRIHREMGTWLGGVHLELTGEDVTECTGGARGLCDMDLSRAYKSQVDPRLNAEQALELALRMADSFLA
jgi:3-deoxy-7-phosphoheptulonate synthase